MAERKNQGPETGTDPAETGTDSYLKKKTTVRKAGKEYICQICLSRIRKGERYVRDTRRAPGKSRPDTLHIECMRMIYGEGVTEE